MSDIRQWLEQLGLGKYADAFEAEEVELNHLSDLTDAELKDLGVPLGPRKTLLRAVRETRRGGLDGDEAEPDAAEVHARIPEAERRQLTVMFCDLVGSTALSKKLDPEDLRGLMQAYQKVCGDVVERYEGHVAQYLGDGLMTYFGWPRAHEDDAQRAVQAGLEIVQAVQRIDAPVALAVRVGISTARPSTCNDSSSVFSCRSSCRSRRRAAAFPSSPATSWSRTRASAAPGWTVP